MRRPRHSFRKNRLSSKPILGKGIEETTEDSRKKSYKISWSPLLKETQKKKKRDWINALLLTLAAHLLLIFFLPKLWKPITFSSLAKDSPLELEYAINNRDDRYVEVNPEVAVEEPPRTPYFASRSQVAAQADPHLVKKDNEPTLDGEEPLSQKIVEASIEKMPTPLESTTPDQSSSPSDNELSETTLPLPNIFEEKAIPQITEGLIAQKKPEPTEKLVAAHTVEVSDVKTRPKPRPRPRVEQPTIPGPLRKTYGGASRLGQTAISARFSEYGAYLDRLFESIYYQWKLLLTNYKFLAEDYNTVVEVLFTLDKEGHINNIKVVRTNASDLATFICKDSICSLAPFDTWTDQMVKTLGEEQELGIVFHFR